MIQDGDIRQRYQTRRYNMLVLGQQDLSICLVFCCKFRTKNDGFYRLFRQMWNTNDNFVNGS
jgi:hypothetical protein